MVDALIDIVPNIEHKNCVRHLYTNFKTNGRHTRKALKDCLWKAAIATTTVEFQDVMKEMNELSIEAHK